MTNRCTDNIGKTLTRKKLDFLKINDDTISKETYNTMYNSNTLCNYNSHSNSKSNNNRENIKHHSICNSNTVRNNIDKNRSIYLLEKRYANNNNIKSQHTYIYNNTNNQNTSKFLLHQYNNTDEEYLPLNTNLIYNTEHINILRMPPYNNYKQHYNTTLSYEGKYTDSIIERKYSSDTNNTSQTSNSIPVQRGNKIIKDNNISEIKNLSDISNNQSVIIILLMIVSKLLPN